MRIVCVPENSIDGHVLVQRLAKREINAFLHGEHQQSAFGATHIGGGVRVLVEDADFAAARVVVAEWEAERLGVGDSARKTDETDHSRRADRAPHLPYRSSETHPAIGQSMDPDAAEADAAVPVARVGFSRLALFSAVVAGVVCGALSVLAIQYLGQTQYASDQNNDGKPDEHSTYDSAGQLKEYWRDRNLDGRKDEIIQYRADRIFSAEMDDNFDGRFEYQVQYHGERALMTRDSDGDGFAEYRQTDFQDVIQRIDYYAAAGKIVRSVTFKHGLHDQSEWDADGDGVLESKGRFDQIERETLSLKPQ